MQHCAGTRTYEPRFSSGGTAAQRQTSQLPGRRVTTQDETIISRSAICQLRCQLALYLGGRACLERDTHLSVCVCQSLTRGAATGTVSGTLPPGRGTLRGSRTQQPLLACPALGSVLELASCKQALVPGPTGILSFPAWLISLGMFSRPVHLTAHTGTSFLYIVNNTPRIYSPTDEPFGVFLT